MTNYQEITVEEELEIMDAESQAKEVLAKESKDKARKAKKAAADKKRREAKKAAKLEVVEVEVAEVDILEDYLSGTTNLRFIANKYDITISMVQDIIRKSEK